MRDPENIGAVRSAGVDMIGFIFAQSSPRYVGDLSDARGFEAAIGTARVAVFLDADFDEISRLLERLPFEVVQLHGSEPPDLCAALKARFPDLTVVKSFNVGSTFSFTETARYSRSCDYYLFDSESRARGGSGEPFDWSRLGEYDNHKPIFLAGGLDEAGLSEVRGVLRGGVALYALDLNSRLEIAPGVKDHDRIQRIVEEVRQWNIP
jgi:phosphoribosylanthranilate isomerase